jgi:hypothetical protein
MAGWWKVVTKASNMRVEEDGTVGFFRGCYHVV